jgi:hypothetical protein
MVFLALGALLYAIKKIREKQYLRSGFSKFFPADFNNSAEKIVGYL